MQQDGSPTVMDAQPRWAANSQTAGSLNQQFATFAFQTVPRPPEEGNGSIVHSPQMHQPPSHLASPQIVTHPVPQQLDSSDPATQASLEYAARRRASLPAFRQTPMNAYTTVSGVRPTTAAGPDPSRPPFAPSFAAGMQPVLNGVDASAGSVVQQQQGAHSPTEHSMLAMQHASAPQSQTQFIQHPPSTAMFLPQQPRDWRAARCA